MFKTHQGIFKYINRNSIVTKMVDFKNHLNTACCWKTFRGYCQLSVFIGLALTQWLIWLNFFWIIFQFYVFCIKRRTYRFSTSLLPYRSGEYGYARYIGMPSFFSSISSCCENALKNLIMTGITGWLLLPLRCLTICWRLNHSVMETKTAQRKNVYTKTKINSKIIIYTNL